MAATVVTMVTAIVVVRGCGLARISADTTMITVAITIDARTMIERMKMLRRGRPLLLLLMLLLLLLQFSTIVILTTVVATTHQNLVGVIVQIRALLLLLLLMMMTTVGH